MIARMPPSNDDWGSDDEHPDDMLERDATSDEYGLGQSTKPLCGRDAEPADGAYEITDLDHEAAGGPPHKRQVRRVRDGVCCAVCGYELRGLPRHGDCPECGTAIYRTLNAYLLYNSDPKAVANMAYGAALLLAAYLLAVSRIAIDLMGWADTNSSAWATHRTLVISELILGGVLLCFARLARLGAACVTLACIFLLTQMVARDSQSASIWAIGWRDWQLPVAMLAMVIGAWYLASPERTVQATESQYSARRLVRYTAALVLVSDVLLQGFAIAGMFGPLTQGPWGFDLDEARRMLHCFTIPALIIVTANHGIDLLWRNEDHHYAEKLKYLMVLLPLMVLAILMLSDDRPWYSPLERLVDVGRWVPPVFVGFGGALLLTWWMGWILLRVFYKLDITASYAKHADERLAREDHLRSLGDPNKALAKSEDT